MFGSAIFFLDINCLLVNFKDMFINAVSLSRKNFLVINVQVLIKRFGKNY